MDKSTHEIRFTQWKQIISQCQNRPKGQTAKQWLADNQIGEKSYYYWFRKVRKEAYRELQDNPPLPAMPGNNDITFAEMLLDNKPKEELFVSFRPAAVIKTSQATVAFSDNISDRMLSRILKEVTHA